GRWGVLHDERPKSKRREQLIADFCRRPPIIEPADVELDRHISANGQQLAAAAGVVRVGQQRLAVLLLGDFGGVFGQRVQRPVGRDQVPRALLADARYAFDVVDDVAHQRERVHDTIGRDAELLFDAGGVVPRTVVTRVEDADLVAYKLEEILVSGHDGHAV